MTQETHGFRVTKRAVIVVATAILVLGAVQATRSAAPAMCSAPGMDWVSADSRTCQRTLQALAGHRETIQEFEANVAAGKQDSPASPYGDIATLDSDSSKNPELAAAPQLKAHHEEIADSAKQP